MSTEILRPKLTQAEFNSFVVKALHERNYKLAASFMWPDFKQNEETERIWNAIEKYKYLCIIGHASASKTFTASIFFLCDWLTFSKETALILTSDTIGSMDRRIWADIKTLWTKSRSTLGDFGEIIDSKRMIRRDINDGKNAIHAVAAESDDSQSKIQGIHTKRIRVVVDEADNPYSSSIWTALTNLGTSGDFKCVALANANDKNSEFGFHCEPKDGWDSINPEMDFEWDSKLGWHVLRLDGLQSPNIKAGKDLFPFLLTNQGVSDIRDKKGEQSPEWWSYVRAWYPPEGLIKTIFPGNLLGQCNKPLIWYTKTFPVASCDPAFEGGDNCVLMIGKMGRLATDVNRWGVELQEYITIKRKDTAKPITHDFGDQIFLILKERGVEAGNFAIDCTGNGLGLSDYIKALFGEDSIMAVKFGEAASNRKITSEDTTVSKDRFKTFVSELWYVAREWCRMGLVYIKEPPRELRIQLESRRYELVGKNLIMAETKGEMKARGLTSPDFGDTFCLMIHLVRAKAEGFLPGTFKDAKHASSMKMFRKNESVWQQDYGIDQKE